MAFVLSLGKGEFISSRTNAVWICSLVVRGKGASVSDIYTCRLPQTTANQLALLGSTWSSIRSKTDILHYHYL